MRKNSSAGDRRRASNLAASYAPDSFGGLKEVGAALDDVLARQANFHKKNPWHLVVLMYGVYDSDKEGAGVLTRAKAASTSTSQTPAPEATLGESSEQVKDKSKSHPLKTCQTAEGGKIQAG